MSGNCDFTLFLSYSPKRYADEVHEFYKHLSKTYNKIWIDVKEMKNGFVHETMSDGVHNSEIFLACLTDEYTKTENSMRELRLAAGLEKTIIFVIFEDVKGWSRMDVLHKYGLIDTYTNDQSYFYYRDINDITESIDIILLHKKKMAQNNQFRNSASSLSSASSMVDYHNDENILNDDDDGFAS